MAKTRRSLLDDTSVESDFSEKPLGDFDNLARDRIPIRSMEGRDLDEVVEIDRRIVGRARRAYYDGLMTQVLEGAGLRISLVAEMDGKIVGFIMARVDYGEFGRVEPAAVMDTIGVHPDYRYQEVGTALISQLVTNLSALRIDGLRTMVRWDGFELQTFLERVGFRPAQRLCLQRKLN